MEKWNKEPEPDPDPVNSRLLLAAICSISMATSGPAAAGCSVCVCQSVCVCSFLASGNSGKPSDRFRREALLLGAQPHYITQHASLNSAPYWSCVHGAQQEEPRERNWTRLSFRTRTQPESI